MFFIFLNYRFNLSIFLCFISSLYKIVCVYLQCHYCGSSLMLGTVFVLKQCMNFLFILKTKKSWTALWVYLLPKGTNTLYLYVVKVYCTARNNEDVCLVVNKTVIIQRLCQQLSVFVWPFTMNMPFRNVNYKKLCHYKKYNISKVKTNGVIFKLKKINKK